MLSTMIFLAGLPSRAMNRERQREQALVRAQLAKARANVLVDQRGIAEGTISYDRTSR
jgi:hypothetical protein